MAKKILSILCALAMMVTMVSVAAFSASAAETTTVNLLDSTNINKWAVTRENDNSWSMYSGAIDLTSQNLTGITGTLVLTNPNSGTYNYVDFDYEDALELGDDFVIDTTVFIKTNITADTTPNKDSYVALNLGDYSVRLVRFVDDAASESAWDRSNFRVALYKNDTLVKKSEIITGTTALYNGDPYANGFNGSNGDAPAEYIRTNAKNGADGAASGKVSFGKNSGWKDLTITVKDGTLSVADTTGVVLTETVEAGAFDNVTPSVRLFNDNNVMKLQPTAVFALNVTTNGTSTGGEGGETPDPEVPDPEVPTSGTFDALSDMTVSTRAYKNGSTWYNSLGSAGYYSDYYSSDAIVASQGMITAESGPYNVGDEFSISYNVIRGDYPGSAGTQPDGSVAHGYHNIVVLGDLKIELYSGNTPFITIDAYYGDQKIIDGATTSTSSDNNYGTKINTTDQEFLDVFSFNRNANDTAYVGELYNKISTAASGGANTYYAANKRKVETTITYNNGTLTVTYGAIGVATPFTATAQLTNADFSDANLSVSVAEIYNRGTILYDFEGTYTPYVAPAVDPLAPGKFLSINDSLAINFAYAEGALADYTDVEVNASIGGKGETLTSVKKTLTDGVYDVYVVDFLTPDLFGTDVEFSITAKKGGADVSYETTYSVKDYCVNMMNASGSSNELKSLCAAILEYGEAARLWKLDEGKTAPATSITDGLTYTAPTKWTADGKTSTFGLSGEPTNVVAEWGEFNLNLADNVGANLEVILDAGESIDNYYASIDGINVVGGDLESLVSLSNNKYKAVIRVYAYEMANDFTVKVKEVGTNEDVSYTFTTGVQNYILKGIETGVFVEGATDYNCAVALLTYGAAAAAYNS